MVDELDVALAATANDDVAQPDLPQACARWKTATGALNVDPVSVEGKGHLLD